MFNSLLLLLLVAVFVSTIFHRFRLPAIVGYIVVGMLLGPHSLGWVRDLEAIKDLAEFGIVFLMFAIGLEFSLARLMSMKYTVFCYGGLQVLICLIVTILAGLALHMKLAETVIIGSIVAMSSTAIVMKQLTEQVEINSAHGIDSLGILLFQDLAVIPLLILIPTLAVHTTSHIYINLSWSLGKGILAVILILSIARWALRPIFYKIAQTQSLELFTLATLLVALSAAWLTHQLGLSLVLGAFLAGMMLGGTEFRHQIENDIRPFRDVLLGFFFITIGMQFDPRILPIGWPWILLLLTGLIVFKTVLITMLGLLFRRDIITASRTGIILAHGGEFGFALLSVAMTYHLLPIDYSQAVLGSLLLSMMLAPIFIYYNKRLCQWVFPQRAKIKRLQTHLSLHEKSRHLSDHVIICGYGRVGQNIARFLEKVNLKFIALDLDPERVASATLAGDNIVYADCSRYEMLKHANIDKAKALVISFYGTQSAKKILQQVRRFHRKLPIIIRSYDDSEVEHFYKMGATEVIPETQEASLMLASHILLLMNIPAQTVNRLITESRLNHYDLLRMVFPGQELLAVETAETNKQGLKAVHLEKNAYAIGRSLKEFNFEQREVKVTKVYRHGKQFRDPNPDYQLQSGDVVVLYGDLSELNHCENQLLEG